MSTFSIETAGDRHPLILEGGMGSMLQQGGMPNDMCPMLCNLEMPELVGDIHRRYTDAGAQVAISNTFSGTRTKLAAWGLERRFVELNRAGVSLARQGNPGGLVFADMGPCGLVMRPIGQSSFDEMFMEYRDQASVLLLEKPDALLIETMVDIADARCALLACIDAVREAGLSTPVAVCCTFDEQGRMPLSGTTPAVAATILSAVGADAIGINCGMGPERMINLLEEMREATDLPLIIEPNAGIPTIDDEGRTVYPGTPAEMAEAAMTFRKIGASLIGSCCGTTPEFTSAIREAVFEIPAPKRTKLEDDGCVRLASPRKVVTIGADQPVRIIGERINPTGKKALADELRAGRTSIVRDFAQEQTEAGADLLDVNVGAVDVDARRMLVESIHAISGITDCPLVFDTTDYMALEDALKAYPGRALINSVNGDPRSYGVILDLARRYGAAVLILALDDNGIPKTAAERLEIVERVRAEAHEAGLRDSDLIVDSLTMTAAADPDAPGVTLDGVRKATGLGLATSLGVSNVSHGLPERSLLNAAFLEAAIAAGLTAAIINPNTANVSDVIRMANARQQRMPYEEAHHDWVAAYEHAIRSADSHVDELVAGEEGDSDTTRTDPRKRLVAYILRGDTQAAPDAVDAVMEEGLSPTDVIEQVLTPALKTLGDAFARDEVFIPQLVAAGDAMKAAVGRCKTHLETSSHQIDNGRVVFCTVKGDVHSIGKDICVTLLESQGYRVFDLGVDVPASRVLQTVLDERADCVCLSALMTTTLPAMQQTVEEMHREFPDIPVLVGGAVVTPHWAEQRQALYSDNALSCVATVASAIEDGGEDS